MSANLLKRLIEEEFKKALLEVHLREQQPSKSSSSSPPPPTSQPSEPSAPPDAGAAPSAGASSGADTAGGSPDAGSTGGLEGPGMDTGAAGEGGGGDSSEGDLAGDDAGMGSSDIGAGGFGGLGGVGGGGGGGGGADSGEPSDISPEDQPGQEAVAPPEQSPEDPIGAAVEEAKKVAGESPNVQSVVNAVKASIQVNFTSYQDAWPIIKALKDTGDPTLVAAAGRLSLFIADILEENSSSKRKTMKVSKQELQGLIREAVRAKLQEQSASMFDAHRAQLEQERKMLDSQLNGADIKEMAIDTFEKLCGKCGVAEESLTPEAKEVVNKELVRMQSAIQEIANVLMQTSAVINAAHGEPVK